MGGGWEVGEIQGSGVRKGTRLDVCRARLSVSHALDPCHGLRQLVSSLWAST